MTWRDADYKVKASRGWYDTDEYKRQTGRMERRPRGAGALEGLGTAGVRQASWATRNRRSDPNPRANHRLAYRPYAGRTLARERRRNLDNPERFRVRLRAPFSIASVQTFSGRHINVEPDGTIVMSADDAQYPRMASGIGGRPRKSGSHWTPRWREMDSNPRSPAIGRPPRDDRIRKRPGRQWVALSTVVSLRSV